MQIKITRRSKVGWGYNTTPLTGYDYPTIAPTTAPDFEGTIRTITPVIEDCKHQLGRIWHTSAWFVRQGGRWLLITEDIDFPLHSLLMGYDDEITVEAQPVEDVIS